MADDALFALEIGKWSSLALTRERRLDQHGAARHVLTVVEGFAPIELHGKVIMEGEQTVASVPLDDDAIDRLTDALVALRAKRRAEMDRVLDAVIASGRK